jgi:hypothetical protein
VVKCWKVPKEEAAVETLGALENRYGDWHLAVGWCQQPKKQIQGNNLSQQKLAAAQGWLTRCAISAPR